MVIFEWLQRALVTLTNRGYDSTGIGTVHLPGKLACSRALGQATSLTGASHAGAIAGVGHNRWATHGSVSLGNTHPHTWGDRLALVHNGIISNAHSMLPALEGEGLSLRGESDSERLVVLLGQRAPAASWLETLRSLAAAELQGTWAVAFVDTRQPDRLFFMRRQSPLLCAYAEDTGLGVLCSEDSVLRVGQRWMEIPDETVGCLTAGGDLCILHTGSGALSTHLVRHLPQVKEAESEQAAGFGPHRCWMEKEILENPASLHHGLSGRIRWVAGNPVVSLEENDADRAVAALLDHQAAASGVGVLLLGCGTSLHACRLAAADLQRAKVCQFALALDASDFEPHQVPSHAPLLVLLVSQSGETMDLHSAQRQLRQYPTLAVINVENSLIAREAQATLYTRCGREVAVASTKSFVSQCAMLRLIVLYMRQKVDPAGAQCELLDMCRLPAAVGRLSLPDEVLPTVRYQQHLFILGRGMGHVVAQEAALKLKEVAYLHAEAVVTGAIKHGTLALIYAFTPVVVICLEDEHVLSSRTTCQELQARGAVVIVVTHDPSLVTPQMHRETKVVVVEVDRTLDPWGRCMHAAVQLQYLAMSLALDRNLNPDFPRNLAKVVTVE